MKNMTEDIFFADTYALIEIIRGNNNYKPYLQSIFITSKFNLIEIYYHFLHDFNKETADSYLKALSSIIAPISFSCIRKGIQFKLKYKKEKVSYVDCIGYALALEFGIKFITGDQKFEDKDNVEFVK